MGLKWSILDLFWTISGSILDPKSLDMALKAIQMGSPNGPSEVLVVGRIPSSEGSLYIPSRARVIGNSII
jgi:hypothetical protein